MGSAEKAPMMRYIYGASLVLFIAAALWLHGLRVDAIKAEHEREIVAVKKSLTTECNKRIEVSDEICRKSKEAQLAECSRAVAMSGRVLRATCGNLAATGAVSNGTGSLSRYRLLGADGQFLVEFARLCSSDSQQVRPASLEK